MVPDIVVTDGGVAQLRIAESVFAEKQSMKPIPAIVSVVKDEQHKPKSVIGKNEDLIAQYSAEVLLANAEAHRFAIAFQKMRRKKNFIHKKKKN